MSESCNQSCSSCSENCGERKEPLETRTDFSEKLNEMSSVKKVIGIVSGKGGVGKSLVTSMLAVSMNIENMSYFKCPDNGKDYQIFAESHIDEVADKHNLKVLAKLPINPEISNACDKGLIEMIDVDSLNETAKIIENI